MLVAFNRFGRCVETKSLRSTNASHKHIMNESNRTRYAPPTRQHHEESYLTFFIYIVI